MPLKILFSLCIPGCFFFFEKPFIFILHHPVPHVIVKLSIVMMYSFTAGSWSLKIGNASFLLIHSKSLSGKSPQDAAWLLLSPKTFS